MRNTLETRLGIFVALSVIAAVLILETVGGVDRFRRGYHLNADFRSVQELKVGDRVKMAGVELGRVEDIQLTNNMVRIVMKLNRKKTANVKTDSIARVRFTGLLGQNYVAIDFGSPTAPSVSEGALLKTEEQPDLSAIMQKIDNVASGVENLTRSFTGDKIDNLIGPFTDFIKANRVPLTAAIANLQAISGQIAQGQGTIGKLIYDDSLYNSASSTVANLQTNLTDMSAEIKLTLADARKAIDQVNSGQGTIGKLLYDEALYRETADSMTNLKEILQKVNRGDGSVGKLVNDQEFYRNAKLTLQKLDKATEGLEDQGPLSVLGIIVNNLF
jgi:phospholipid/cholesterol/gamma-HCH transport system substrate-binding protein